jgi:hypothetical protein
MDITNILPKDITLMKRQGLNLVANYWTPVNKDENRRLIFIETKALRSINEETGEEKILNTCVFVDPTTKEVVHQSSSRLVGVFERETPTPGEIFEIVYLGKIKNTTNAYMSDNWAVYRLKDSIQ